MRKPLSPQSVFLLYAKEDEHVARLLKSDVLALLQSLGKIEGYCDEKIRGRWWQGRTRRLMESADLIILVMSPYILRRATPFILGIADKSTVLLCALVQASDCPWQTIFSTLRIVPDRDPTRAWHDHSERTTTQVFYWIKSHVDRLLGVPTASIATRYLLEDDEIADLFTIGVEQDFHSRRNLLLTPEIRSCIPECPRPRDQLQADLDYLNDIDLMDQWGNPLLEQWLKRAKSLFSFDPTISQKLNHYWARTRTRASGRFLSHRMAMHFREDRKKRLPMASPSLAPNLQPRRH